MEERRFLGEDVSKLKFELKKNGYTNRTGHALDRLDNILPSHLPDDAVVDCFSRPANTLGGGFSTCFAVDGSDKVLWVSLFNETYW